MVEPGNTCQNGVDVADAESIGGLFRNEPAILKEMVRSAQSLFRYRQHM